MSSKYLSAASATIVTIDLYLAAFLLCVSCGLGHKEHNGRRRGSTFRYLQPAPVRYVLFFLFFALSQYRKLPP